ncbi:MAG: F0F1 ATP synthase subunit B [Bacteroidales bacterium]|nr:F0F1 ATP synthase subunit B [Bacteroidales bacterium]MDP3002369.1 F0F1 ATP synthase subunit B [Bacteroidales bacterium]
MILLASSLTTPAIGTLFWSALIFGLFFLILTKFAWKPILNAVKARDELIKGSLESAEKAREEMLKWQSDNEAILRKAREEREGILKEAREVRDKLISEAKGKAAEEAEKLVEKARTGIEREKIKALSEIHEQVATLSVEIASKLLGEKLKQTGEQEKLIDNYLKEIDFNKN